jgi:hypothetical protein
MDDLKNALNKRTKEGLFIDKDGNFRKKKVGPAPLPKPAMNLQNGALTPDYDRTFENDISNCVIDEVEEPRYNKSVVQGNNISRNDELGNYLSSIGLQTIGISGPPSEARPEQHGRFHSDHNHITESIVKDHQSNIYGAQSIHHGGFHSDHRNALESIVENHQSSVYGVQTIHHNAFDSDHNNMVESIVKDHQSNVYGAQTVHRNEFISNHNNVTESIVHEHQSNVYGSLIIGPKDAQSDAHLEYEIKINDNFDGAHSFDREKDVGHTIEQGQSNAGDHFDTNHHHKDVSEPVHIASEPLIVLPINSNVAENTEKHSGVFSDIIYKKDGVSVIQIRNEGSSKFEAEKNDIYQVGLSKTELSGPTRISDDRRTLIGASSGIGPTDTEIDAIYSGIRGNSANNHNAQHKQAASQVLHEHTEEDEVLKLLEQAYSVADVPPSPVVHKDTFPNKQQTQLPTIAGQGLLVNLNKNSTIDIPKPLRSKPLESAVLPVISNNPINNSFEATHFYPQILEDESKQLKEPAAVSLENVNKTSMHSNRYRKSKRFDTPNFRQIPIPKFENTEPDFSEFEKNQINQKIANSGPPLPLYLKGRRANEEELVSTKKKSRSRKLKPEQVAELQFHSKNRSHSVETSRSPEGRIPSSYPTGPINAHTLDNRMHAKSEQHSPRNGNNLHKDHSSSNVPSSFMRILKSLMYGKTKPEGQHPDRFNVISDERIRYDGENGLISGHTMNPNPNGNPNVAPRHRRFSESILQQGSKASDQKQTPWHYLTDIFSARKMSKNDRNLSPSHFTQNYPRNFSSIPAYAYAPNSSPFQFTQVESPVHYQRDPRLAFGPSILHSLNSLRPNATSPAVLQQFASANDQNFSKLPNFVLEMSSPVGNGVGALSTGNNGMISHPAQDMFQGNGMKMQNNFSQPWNQANHQYQASPLLMAMPIKQAYSHDGINTPNGWNNQVGNGGHAWNTFGGNYEPMSNNYQHHMTSQMNNQFPGRILLNSSGRY